MEPKNSDRLSFFNANLLYMAVMILFVTVGYIAQQRDFHYGILITEFLLIALPTIIYVKIIGASVKKELRFNSLSLIDALLVIVTAVAAYFVAVFINLIAEILISMMGDLIVPDIPFARNPGEYFKLLFIIAGSAGICEEILFRGFILRAYEKLGMWPDIIITAVLFSILHLNVQNIVAPLFLGIILGFVVYKTNSIYAGIIGHFINNAVSVTWGYVIMSLPFYEGINIEQAQEGVTTQSLIGAAALFGFVLPFAGTIMALCLKTISDRHPEAASHKPDKSSIHIIRSIKLSWPLLICLLIFIGMMIMETILIISGRPLLNF
ncbi:MAG: type II CAAX endopeptidase family protein [Clostridiaceae bacterium]|nr:type II CAAX endopeptidase family protein [Clostridiaceae bacterium]